MCICTSKRYFDPKLRCLSSERNFLVHLERVRHESKPHPETHTKRPRTPEGSYYLWPTCRIRNVHACQRDTRRNHPDKALIGMIAPSDVVMALSVNMEFIADCIVAFMLQASGARAAAAMGSLFQDIVTAGVDGVAGDHGAEATGECAGTRGGCDGRDGGNESCIVHLLC